MKTDLRGQWIKSFLSLVPSTSRTTFLLRKIKYFSPVFSFFSPSHPIYFTVLVIPFWCQYENNNFFPLLHIKLLYYFFFCSISKLQAVKGAKAHYNLYTSTTGSPCFIQPELRLGTILKQNYFETKPPFHSESQEIHISFM